MGDNDTGREDAAADESVDDEDVDANTDEGSEDDADTSENTAAEDGSDDDSDDDAGDDGEGDSDESSDNADDESDEEDDDADDDEEEPQTRSRKKSNADFVAERRAKKIAKMQRDKDKGGEDDDSGDDDASDEDSEDDDSPEETAKINKILDQRLAPIEKKEAEQEVDGQIAEFISENPDFKPFEAKVRRWANHKDRQGIPVESIFYEVAGKKLMALGAKRGRAADVKANKTKSGGSGAAETKGNQSYKNMDLTDFGKVLDAEKTKER